MKMVMDLKCGQKVIVRSQMSGTFLNGRILNFFHLNEGDVKYMRGKSQHNKSKAWDSVQSGDRAFYFKALQDAPETEPRVFVLGYSELYICTR